MKSLVITLFLVTLFGQTIAQIKFYLSFDIYGKMSVTSDDPYYFETKVYNNSPQYEYETNNFSLAYPMNFGFSSSVSVNGRHEFIFGLNTDGSASYTKLKFETYQAGFGYIPNRLNTKSKNPYNRFFLNYKYAVIYSEKKANLSLLMGIGLVQRAGPKYGGEETGGWGTSAIIDEYGTTLTYENMSYTNLKKGYLINLGLGTELYFKNKYLFNVSLIYTRSRFSLGTEENKIILFNQNTGYFKEWTHSINLMCSGLYLGIARKFQLFPNKYKEKKKHIIDSN